MTSSVFNLLELLKKTVKEPEDIKPKLHCLITVEKVDLKLEANVKTIDNTHISIKILHELYPMRLNELKLLELPENLRKATGLEIKAQDDERIVSYVGKFQKELQRELTVVEETKIHDTFINLINLLAL